MLVPGVIIPFDGAHAAIPAGFVRETTLDGLFPKGAPAATNPGSTGGNATHSHTSPTHTHTIPAHTHTYTSGGVSGTTNNGHDGSGVSQLSLHGGTSGAMTGGVTSADAATYASTSNNPPYYEVIFIRSTSYNLIPVNGMIFNEQTGRTSLTFHSASADKFLRGAPTSGDAGGTGGSLTNTHSINHTHTSPSHAHASAVSSGYSRNSSKQSTGSNGGTAADPHNHTFSFSNTTVVIDAYSGSLVTTETVQPLHRTLNPYKNATANGVVPASGDIAMWLGTLATIPVGWKLCDGTNSTPDMRDYFTKVPATASSPVTDGANTHTHAAQSHTHTTTGASHTHGLSSGVPSATVIPGGGDTQVIDTDVHTHGGTSDASSASYGAANTTADSSNNEPQYLTVAFIKLDFLAGGGLLPLLT